MEIQQPTKLQRTLVAYADEAEAQGQQTSLYYRLYPQIIEARAAIAKEQKQNASNP